MGAVVLGTGVEGAAPGGAVGVELGDVVTDGGAGGVAAATVIGAGGPIAGPVGDEVEVVLGMGTERIAALAGTGADEFTEAGELTEAAGLTEVGKLAEAGELTEAVKAAEPVELTTADVAPAARATGIAAGVTTAGSPLSSSAVVAAVADGGAAARGTGVGLPETGAATAASDLVLAAVSAGSLITS